MQSTAPLLSTEAPCDETAPSLIRESMTPLEQLDWLLGDAMIVASELVTNAVLHSGCASEDRIRVQIRRADGQIVISVEDPGRSEGEAIIRANEFGASGGLGLAIVSTLASKWGTERGAGYRVWAELATSETPYQAA